ncbi:MAG: DUF5686 family protein [Bacteroidota bacterium]
MLKTGYLTAVLLFFIPNWIYAQVTITGKVTDRLTGEPLSAAHVIVKGTYKGTIANVDGEYSIKVDRLPVTLSVRYLGYNSKEIEVVEGSAAQGIDFLMEESLLELGEITVTGEDPAISIMKEVIRRKQIWRAKLETYQAEAYTRQQLLNDTSIVSITESFSVAYWDKERGPREVLKSRRQTANIEGSDNFAGVSYLPNFYDDDLEIAGFDVRGVTHPRALSFYNFSLKEYRKIDDDVVYEIEVKPKKPFQPLFEGTIWVLDLEYALLEVELKPNKVISFPPPVQDFDLYYRQQFSNYGGEYWLPVDVRIEGLVKVGFIGLRFPPIGFKQFSRMDEYQVNQTLPDSVYNDNDWFSVDSTTINLSDSLFVSSLEPVPLSQEEEIAYETIDSTTSLEEEFRPKGFLVRFLDLDDDDDDDDDEEAENRRDRSNRSNEAVSNDTSSTSPKRKGARPFRPVRKALQSLDYSARYNRVDAFFAGASYERRFLDRRLRTRFNGGYSFGYEEPTYGAEVSWWPLKSRRMLTYAGYYGETATRNHSYLYNFGSVFSSFFILSGNQDYFDYYRVEGAKLGMRWRVPSSARIIADAGMYLEEHSSIDFMTQYSVLGDPTRRRNTQIEDGTLNALRVNIKIGEDDRDTFGAIGVNMFELDIEQAHDALGSDWSFTRASFDFYRRIPTFYKRRFIPNALEVRLSGGTYLGDLPIQRNGVVDVRKGIFTPFGAFKTRGNIPYEGASYLSAYAEHNFRTIPFELLGWRNAPKSGLSMIAFGGVAHSWIPDEQEEVFNRDFVTPFITDGTHAEVGFSVSNIFSLFRVDAAVRVDQPNYFIGISLARIF